MANTGFLQALARADPFDEYHFYLAGPGQEPDVRAVLAQANPGLATRGAVRFFSRLDLPAQLRAQGYHAFHLSDCMTTQPHLSRLRNLYAPRIFPVTGGIHSLSYAGHAAALLAHLWAGVTPRDAIVCTSAAGEATVQAYFTHLRKAYGLAPHAFIQPRLEHIPLGAELAALPTAQERCDARARLGMGQDETVVLVFGRLQHHSKMDLLPLFRAFQRLFSQGLPRAGIRLALAGWADEGDHFPATLQELAANLDMTLTLALRPDGAAKRALYAAADIFCSVADNPQETFGLTILEAGAMGLPTIASDYDGYRDLVVHAETGLLMPTLGASEHGSELDALARVLYDNQYHLLLAQRTVVEVGALAQGLGDLLTNPQRRSDMGRAARRHVERSFCWDAVVRQHLELWERLWSEPMTAVEEHTARTAEHPLHAGYTEVFCSHPSAVMEDGLHVVWSRAGQAVYRSLEFPLIYAGVTQWVEPNRLRELLFAARKPVAVGELLRGMTVRAGLSRERAEYLLLWALKHDFIELAASGMADA